MKLSEVITKLSQLDSEINEKDTLLLQFYGIIDTVDALFSDSTFKTSSVYSILKLKYLSDLEKKIDAVRTKKIKIDPLYIPVKKIELIKEKPISPKGKGKEKSSTEAEEKGNLAVEEKAVEIETKGKGKLTKRPQLITSEVNSPMEPNIYLNPKSKPKIILSDKKVKNTIKTLHSFVHDKITYFINFDTGIIYNDDLKNVGTILDNTIRIGEINIQLKESSVPGVKINDFYSLTNN